MKSFEEFAKDYGCLPYREIKELYEAYKQGFKEAVIHFHNLKENGGGLEYAELTFQTYFSDIAWDVF